MKIGFLAARRSAMKGLGPVVAEAIRRGHTPYLLYDPVCNQGIKSYENPTPEILSTWAPAIPVEVPIGQWMSRLKELGVEAVIGEMTFGWVKRFGWLPEIDGLREAGVKIFSVNHLWEVTSEPPEIFRCVDMVFYWCQAQREMHERICRQLGGEAFPSSSVNYCGSTMFDQLKLVHREEARRRLGIPPDRKVLLFLSPKMQTGDPWRRIVMGSERKMIRAARAIFSLRLDLLVEMFHKGNYRQILGAVQAFCRSQNALLIVKSKKKNADPSFVIDGADIFMYDESDYPYTSMELLAISDLCIHFGSGAVFEAAFAGVPSLSIPLPQSHVSSLSPRLKAVINVFREELPKEGIFNWRGVVYPLNRGAFVSQFAKASFSEYPLDVRERKRYVERFVGFDDTDASSRLLDEVERLLRLPALTEVEAQ